MRIVMNNYDVFAREWIEAWNSHNIQSIMAHYANDIDFVSPIAARLLDNTSGQIRNLHDLRSYFLKGLEAYPSLHFELYHVLEGVNSVTLVYKSVNDMIAAEYMEINKSGKVGKVRAHYKPLN